jgi:hypothetical protein
MARRETRSGSGLSFEAPAAGSARLPHSCRTAPARGALSAIAFGHADSPLTSSLPCALPCTLPGQRVHRPLHQCPAHAWTPLKCRRRGGCPPARECGAHSARWACDRGGKGGRRELRAISDLLLSHEQRPRPSVHAAQLPQRGLQLPKRHDETATRGHEHIVRQPRPAAPPTAPRPPLPPPLLRRTLAGGMRHRHAAAQPKP